MEADNLWFALGLSTLAGLSTGIGSAIGVLGSRTNQQVLTLSMGFSAGVMVYVSFVELLPEAQHALTEQHGPEAGNWWAILGFFGGMALIGIIDRLVPEPENPHEFPIEAAAEEGDEPKRRLLRVGLLTTLALALHNFPEGIATLLGGLQSPEVGVPIALAVAIHNIPEGIAVAVPIHQATGSKKKAFFYSFGSGLAEPIGALAGYALLLPFLNDTVYGLLMASVGGVMVFISFDQLLPAAERYGKHHTSILGVVLGMLVMAASLVWL